MRGRRLGRAYTAMFHIRAPYICFKKEEVKVGDLLDIGNEIKVEDVVGNRVKEYVIEPDNPIRIKNISALQSIGDRAVGKKIKKGH